MTKNFRHGLSKNRHYTISVMVSKIVIERHGLIPVTVYRKPSQINLIGDGFKPSQ